MADRKPALNLEGLSNGTTISSRRDFGFSGWEGAFPVDAEHLVDAILFVVGLAEFADVDDASVGERESGCDEVVGAEQGGGSFASRECRNGPPSVCLPSASPM